MVEEPISFPRADAVRGPESGPVAAEIRFDRSELDRILNVYGRMVSAGEWRDYAIDFHTDAAVFSVYRRASEMPLFRIEKRPRHRSRQGQYAVIAAAGYVLKRGHELAQVLRVFDKKLIRALAT